MREGDVSSVATKQMAGKGARFVERVYRLRIAGLGLGVFCVASVLAQQERGFVLWALLVFHGFLWPHVARRAALACNVPYRGERVNLMIDAVFGGFWVAAMRFNVLPCVLILTMLSMDNIAAGGLGFFARGILAHLAGLAAGLLILGFAFEPMSLMPTILACLPFLIVYPIALGWSTYRTSRKLAEQAHALDRLSRTDGLTGLLNRRSWEGVLAGEFARSRASRYASSLLLVDLDHFKRVNDTHGHPAGDVVLQTFATTLRAHFRECDQIGRYGGEEFGVVLPGATLAEARARAEQLVATVRGLASRADAGCPCTISVGVAQCDLVMRDHIAWLQKADASLYDAKLGGRDRVVVAEVMTVDAD
ncbi:diguanylate cyclase [Paraburkholderia sp.]|uniref:diguanylate cyclase n=1 Tax=Paraburkholderia sp. TaxID=1926495 RepID=UPI0025FEFFB0|nr:diguanylate cyclase [Paraburkholderia sp.]